MITKIRNWRFEKAVNEAIADVKHLVDQSIAPALLPGLILGALEGFLIQHAHGPRQEVLKLAEAVLVEAGTPEDLREVVLGGIEFH